VSRIVALLSDFGTRDGYVGAMKGVLLSRCAGARIVDVTHEIPPGDVTAGAFALAQAAEWFPPGSVFLCVVDPGVGSQRRAIACAIGPRLYVAPDNGLLSRLLERGDAVSAHGLRSRWCARPGRSRALAPTGARVAWCTSIASET
jgi:S-adenosylmethionine hydrolase